MSDTATADASKMKAPSRTTTGRPRVIAVDGSAASGKSSVGRRLAKHLGYPFLDTGIMYRAITLAALRSDVDPGDASSLGSLARLVKIDVEISPVSSEGGATIGVDGEDVTHDLRLPEVEEAVSLVSKVPEVREALVEQQRRIGANREIVMAGRDIGTVVLPAADLKLYLDASLEERARRRLRDFEDLGREVTQQDVLADIRRRDQIDSERSVSPLRPADDAAVIHTDGLTLEQVVEKALAMVEEGRS